MQLVPHGAIRLIVVCAVYVGIYYIRTTRDTVAGECQVNGCFIQFHNINITESDCADVVRVSYDCLGQLHFLLPCDF